MTAPVVAANSMSRSSAAAGALPARWPLAVGGACVAILVWLIVQLLLVYAFAGAALQA